MKLPISLFLTLGTCWAGEPVLSLPLDDRVVVGVPLATNRVTTFSFPGPITAIEAANVSLDGKGGMFQVSHAKGAAFFSVKALSGGASGNLNVRYQRRTYVFELRESPEPVLALNLAQEPTPRALPAPRLSAERLVALLDKVKAFPLLKAQHPAAVAGVEARVGVTNVTECGEYQVRVEEVYRFRQEDTLVFQVVIANRTEHPLRYAPESFSVRVGDQLYPQSLSEAEGVVPPGGEAPAYVAISGRPDGGRAELSVRNDFQVFVQREEVP